MKLQDIGEFGLIREISNGFLYRDPQIVKGIGDDAAATLLDGERCLLSSVEMLVEGVHFSLTYTPPHTLGRKSISVAVSDIAAMGGVARYILLSIGVPQREGMDLSFFKDFYRGVKEATEAYDLRLIGGNISSSGERLVVGVTVLGEVERQKVVLRSGARLGDRIFVTGTIGDSALGLRLLKKGIENGPYEEAIKKHLNPLPRLKEGKGLAERGIVTAMIDISDGLLADLGHILEESGLGARVYMSQLPLSRAMRSYLEEHPQDRLLPLKGGEDYELLFTAPPSAEERIKELSAETCCPITCIGEVVSREEGMLILDEDGKPLHIDKGGFDHLREDTIDRV